MQVLDAFLEQLSDQSTLEGLKSAGRQARSQMQATIRDTRTFFFGQKSAGSEHICACRQK